MTTDIRTVSQIREALEERGLDASPLAPVGVRPRLATYLRDLWGRRHFIWVDSRYRVGTQNSRNRLGNLWLILRPMLDAALFFVIFGVILEVTQGVDNFAAYIVIGVLTFQATARSVSQGPNLLRSGRAMIRAFSFPRASIPIAAELRDAFQMVYTVLVVLALIVVIPPHEEPRLTWLLVIPIYLLQFALDLGISFVLARVGFLVPDISQAMGIVSRFLMYGSGVIFPIDRYLDHELLDLVVRLNPVYQVVHMYRTVLMGGEVPPPESWIVLGSWSAGLLVLGFVFFWRGEATYGDDR